MLRYFYLLLCLLVCIKWSFCYDYISEQDSYKPVRKRKVDNRGSQRRFKDGRETQREYEVVERDRDGDLSGDRERDPVAQIDLTSFIQKPDYDSIEESPYEVQNTNRRGTISKDYISDYGAPSQLTSEDNVQRKSRDFPSLGISNIHELNVNLDPEASKSGYEDKYETDSNVNHKMQKKSSFKQMKFPFFSHKKYETPKPKKNKKRKLFYRKNKKISSTSTTYRSIEANVINNKIPYDLYKMKKRSYEEHICPLCKRKFVSGSKKKYDSKLMPSKILHNSRQYYQDISDLAKEKEKEDLSNAIEVTDDNLIVANKNSDSIIDADFKEDSRRKRDYRDYDRERQLKELEEVRKKVDSVEVNSPNFHKGNLR